MTQETDNGNDVQNDQTGGEVQGDQNNDGQQAATGTDDNNTGGSQDNGNQSGSDSGDEADKGDKSGGDDTEVSYDLKSPDGVEFSEDDLQGITDKAKELGLDNDKAQTLVNLKAEWQREASDLAEANLGETVKSWENEVRNDSEFGGDKLDESLQDVNRVMSKFGDDELRSALDQTGFGNHPLLFKFVARIGKAMREDGNVSGDPSSQPKSLADVLYSKNNEG